MKCIILLIGALAWATVKADPVPPVTGPASATPDKVKELYHLKSFKFEDVDGPLDPSAASLIDFDYDPYTGHVCGVFKRFDPKVKVPSVACFDVSVYKAFSKDVVFSAFPSLTDNYIPGEGEEEQEEGLLVGRNVPVPDDEVAFEKTPLKLHLQRLFGRSSRASKTPVVVDDVISNENAGYLDGNEHLKPENSHRPHPASADTEGVPGQRKPYNFVSVTKIQFDDCGRMWFLDCGTAFVDTPHEKYVRQPILWSFEVVVTEDRKLVNKLFLRHELMTNFTHNGISDFVVDIHGNKCGEFDVYLANYIDNKMIVYNHKKGFDYEVYDESLTPVMSETKHTFLGKDYQFTGGVFSLALAELTEQGYRDVYYTLGSGNGEYAVNTRALRRRADPKYFQTLGYRGFNVNSLNHVYDSLTKVMFYMHPESKSIKCWNTNHRLVPENVATIYTHDHLATGWSMKIDSSNNLWFMANDFNFFDKKKVEGDLDSFHLFRAKVSEIIEGSICAGTVVKSDAYDEDEDTFDAFIDVLVGVEEMETDGLLSTTTFAPVTALDS